MSVWRSRETLKVFLGAAVGIGIGAAAVVLYRRYRSITFPTKRNSTNKPTDPITKTKHTQTHSEKGEPRVNVEEQSLLQGGPRVKFNAKWIGTLDDFFVKYPDFKKIYDDVCTSLSDQMNEFESLGVAPVAPDGKVGGNCSALIQSESVSRVVVSKSGKAPHQKMDIYSDIAVIENFDFENWSCDYYAREKKVLPTSDAPLHCAVLLDARRSMNWTEYPNVVLHGHAFETEELAKERGYPISTEATLFSTEEDSQALMKLLKEFPYPKDNIYIRKGHGFLLLARNTQNSREIFNARMKPFLMNV